MDAATINKEFPPSSNHSRTTSDSQQDTKDSQRRLGYSVASTIGLNANDGIYFKSEIPSSLEIETKPAEPSVLEAQAQSSFVQIDNRRGILETEPAYEGSGFSESETRNQIYSHLTRIISDRDRLQTELYYAESTILELDAQNRELHRLLRSVQDALRSSDDKAPTQIHPRNLDLSLKANWIGGTWLSCAKTTPLLTGAEAAWQGGKSQEALALLIPMLNEEGLKSSHRINAGLLYSAILRANGDLEGALHHADECLSIAKETEQRQLTGKAQFHKGLCYVYLDRFADARWCFVLASHTEGHTRIIEEYLVMTQQKLTKLEVDDPRAKLFL